MIKHYFKIAWRNLIKYHTQSAVSIIGLAIGFTCFSFCLLWIRYEMTFDTFHEDADRIYLIRTESEPVDKTSSATPYPLAGYLENTFPEVEKACNIQGGGSKQSILYNNMLFEVRSIRADSSTIRFFNITLLEGNFNFIEEKNKEIAITEAFARDFFPDKSPIGEKIQIHSDLYTICAIVRGWDKHSNYGFDIIVPMHKFNYWYASSWQTFIKLSSKINPAQFAQKLYEHEIIRGEEVKNKLTHLLITPITQIRYDSFDKSRKVRFEHLVFFLIGSALVLICSLFNYLSLFANRLYIRNKEMALRKVCGSGEQGLIELIAVEFILTFALTLILGMILTEILLPGFIQLSEIESGKREILLHSFYFTGLLTGFSFLFTLILIGYYRKRSIREMFQTGTGRKSNLSFQKGMIISQITVCTGFIFCSLIMNSQLNYLHHTGEIIERKNQGVFLLWSDPAPLFNQLDKSPYITAYLSEKHTSFFPFSSSMGVIAKDWDGKLSEEKSVPIELINGASAFCNFYNLQLIEGEILQDDDPDDWVMINEKAVQELGIKDPVGKKITSKDQKTKIIKGVLKDFCKTVPTLPVKPTMFIIPGSEFNFTSAYHISFKYKEGHWKDVYTQLKEWGDVKYSPLEFKLYNAEEEFSKLLKSEASLVRLMDFIMVVCILISLFGIYSLVMLDCEKSRKSIAIRKIHGAQMRLIWLSYLKKYLLLLTIGAIIAFPVGYIVMQSWIENYIIRITITPWIYIAIWSGLGIIIIICISGSILKTIRLNPAEIIKND